MAISSCIGQVTSIREDKEFVRKRNLLAWQYFCCDKNKVKTKQIDRLQLNMVLAATLMVYFCLFLWFLPVDLSSSSRIGFDMIAKANLEPNVAY